MRPLGIVGLFNGIKFLLTSFLTFQAAIAGLAKPDRALASPTAGLMPCVLLGILGRVFARLDAPGPRYPSPFPFSFQTLEFAKFRQNLNSRFFIFGCIGTDVCTKTLVLH